MEVPPFIGHLESEGVSTEIHANSGKMISDGGVLVVTLVFLPVPGIEK